MPDVLTDTSKVLPAVPGAPALRLPSLPTNLAQSEGSPLIHASASVLNQPPISGQQGERCGPLCLLRHTSTPTHTHLIYIYRQNTQAHTHIYMKHIPSLRYIHCSLFSSRHAFNLHTQIHKAQMKGRTKFTQEVLVCSVFP